MNTDDLNKLAITANGHVLVFRSEVQELIDERDQLRAQVEQLQKGKLYHVGLLNHIPSKVIDALNAELLYQNEKWGERHIRNQTVEGHLLVLRKELQEAEDGWMKNLTGRNSVESELVQVAAVAIQALINIQLRTQARERR